MKKHLLSILMLSTGLYAFGQNNKSTSTKPAHVSVAKQQQATNRTTPNGSHIMAPPGACDTINFPVSATWTGTNYIAGAGLASGYLNGPNQYGDFQKAMYFDASTMSFTKLIGCWILFDHAYSANPAKVVPINIYDGTSGTPGALIGSKNLTMGQIMADAGFVTDVVFNTPITLPVSKRFFVSVDIRNLTWATAPKDSLSIVTNVDLETNPGVTWDQFNDNSWVSHYDVNNWDLNISNYMFPYLSSTEKTPVSFTQNLTTVCQGGAVNFNGAASMPFGNCVWDFGVGNLPASASTVGQSTITGTFNTVGANVVKLYTVSGGCDQIDSAQVTINVNASPTITANTSASAVCAGSQVTLTGGGAGAGGSYAWTGGATDGLTFTPAGTATYTVTGTAANTCTNTATVAVAVNALPTITASSSAAGTICPGTSITLTGGGAGAGTYIWTGGVTNAAPFVPAASGTYTVTGTDVNNCSGTANVSVALNTVVTPTVTAAGASLSSTSATGYQWLFNGSPISGANAQNYTATQNGNYSVITTDANGCSDTSAVQVVSSIGIKSVSAVAAIKVYPNPSKGVFNVSIELNKNSDYTVELRNVLGQTIYTENVNNSSEFTKSFDMNEKAGLYFVVVKDNAGRSSVHKVIVE